MTLAQEMNLELTDKYEVLTLHRIFFEAKYNSDPEDMDVQASPIGAAIYDRIFDLLIQLSDDDEADRWRSWRSLEQHTKRIPNLKQRIELIHSSNWPDTETEKRDFVLALCSPLLPNDTHVADLITFGDATHKKC